MIIRIYINNSTRKKIIKVIIITKLVNLVIIITKGMKSI